jgi:hypothetical protein
MAGFLFFPFYNFDMVSSHFLFRTVTIVPYDS